mmetsp:Transcript_15355/g.51696  ORF Transcript_15355/g.51696 Transcript_15355/m.51696 type:complete len:223 (+) Transcript_15355:673-1341(+)
MTSSLLAVVFDTTSPWMSARSASDATAFSAASSRSGETLMSSGKAGRDLLRASTAAWTSPVMLPLGPYAAACEPAVDPTLGQLMFSTTKSTQSASLVITVAKSSRASAEDVLRATLAPTPNPFEPTFLNVSRRWATVSTPSEFRPKRLMMAPSSRRRKTRGLALPGCSKGVTPPTSQKPKPMSCKPRMASPCLSKPAATPTGLSNSRVPPKSLTLSESSKTS